MKKQKYRSIEEEMGIPTRTNATIFSALLVLTAIGIIVLIGGTLYEEVSRGQLLVDIVISIIYVQSVRIVSLQKKIKNLEEKLDRDAL